MSTNDIQLIPDSNGYAMAMVGEAAEGEIKVALIRRYVELSPDDGYTVEYGLLSSEHTDGLSAQDMRETAALLLKAADFLQGEA